MLANGSIDLQNKNYAIYKVRGSWYTSTLYWFFAFKWIQLLKIPIFKTANKIMIIYWNDFVVDVRATVDEWKK